MPRKRPPPAPEPAPDPEGLIGPGQVAKLLDVSTDHVRRLRGAGRFPAPDVELGPNTFRWRRSTVLRWIEEEARRKRGRLA